MRLDGNGKQLWEKFLGEPPLPAEAWGALLQPDGSAVITGSQRQASNDFDAQLWRLDALGNLLVAAKLGKAGVAKALLAGAPCSDGDACTKLDTCQSGGWAGVGYFCDDGNPCTLATCDKLEGCVYSAVSDGAVCGAGKACLAGSCL